MRDKAGCNPEVAAKRPVWQYQDGEKTVSLYNCPAFFLTEWSRNFVAIRAAYQSGDAQVPTLLEQPQKYLAAARILDRWKAVFGPLAEKQAEQEALRAMLTAQKGKKL